MFKIEVYLRPSALEGVQKALGEIGIVGMSVTEIRGFVASGHREVYRGAEYRIDFVPKIKVEVTVKDDDKDSAISAIVEASKSGKVGEVRSSLRPSGDACAYELVRQGKVPSDSPQDRRVHFLAAPIIVFGENCLVYLPNRSPILFS